MRKFRGVKTGISGGKTPGAKAQSGRGISGAEASHRASQSRHKKYPCCGYRRAQCKCDWRDVVRHLDKKAWRCLYVRLSSAALLTARDTVDTGFFMQEFSVPVPGHMHKVSAYDAGNRASTAKCFVMRAMAFKRFGSVETWKAIRSAFPPAARPRWSHLERALQVRLHAGQPIFGGLYYASVLRTYWDGKQWMDAGKLSLPKREALSLRLMWDHLPSDKLDMYVKAPSAASFTTLYDGMLDSIRAVSTGILGDYQWKCVLDILVMCDFVADEHISKWPLGRGTKSALQRVFPGLPLGLRLKALYWCHRELATIAGGRFRLPESLMHLCWDERRVSGILTD